MNTVLFSKEGHIGVLTINRPSALNALNSSVLSELSQQLAVLGGSDIRCLIITGAGEKAFVAGADIEEMKELSPGQAASFSDVGNAVMENLESFFVPVIAAINGYALGGGLELALSCDIRLAAENALFGLPEVGLGIVPGYGGMQRLARTVGPGKAKELVYTGTRISALEAKAIGLITGVMPQDELMTACLAMARTIAGNAPVAVRAAKEIINGSIGSSLRQSARLEREAFARCFATKDQHMAMAAFLAKRKPEPFSGSQASRCGE